MLAKVLAPNIGRSIGVSLSKKVLAEVLTPNIGRSIGVSMSKQVSDEVLAPIFGVYWSKYWSKYIEAITSSLNILSPCQVLHKLFVGSIEQILEKVLKLLPNTNFTPNIG